MIKKRRFYTLSDIRKHLVYTPLIFVFLLATIAILVVVFTLEFKKKNELDLFIQEDKFQKQSILKQYAQDLKFNASSSFDKEELNLTKEVLTLFGHLKYNKNSINIESLKSTIEDIEEKNSLDFVLFNKNNYEIIYGSELIDYLKILTGSKLEKSNFRYHMLKNIEYIGDDNLIYWIDKDKRKIRLSYFKQVESSDLYLGAFTKVDDIRNSLRNTILNSIAQKSNYYSNNSYFWFYDYSLGYVYNYYNKAQKLDVKQILENDKLNSSNEILKSYIENSSEKKYNIYNFKKYNFMISMKSFDVPTKISELDHSYNSKLTISIAIIILIALFLIVASSVFSKFINKIFHRYNKRLETKNTLYKKWKDRYELAIIASNDGLWDIDLKTKQIYFSKKWLEMFGYEDGEINSLDEWLDLIHSDDRQTVENRLNDHIKGLSENFICEYRIRTKTLGYKWVLLRGKAFSDDENKPKRMLMMSMDINQRKRLTKELKYVDLLVEYGRIVIFKWKNDDELTVDYLSRSISSYGYDRQEFVDKKVKFFDIVCEEDLEELKEQLKDAIKKDEKSFTKVYRVKDKNGAIKWIFNRTIFLKDDFGNVTHLYGYINDITQMKLTEEELKAKVNEELEKNIEKDRLLVHQSKLAAMGEMLGNIAHQWRQPLNNINLLTHFIRDSYGKLSQEELNGIIEDTKVQINYMSHTIDDFRNFYEPDKDKIEFDVKEAITSCFKIVETQFEKNGLETEINSESIYTINYKNEFQQVILNILNNANDAAIIKKKETSFKPKVVIDIKKLEDSIEVSISNNCGEIPVDMMERIFEPYFTTKFEDQGTGIGLYMAKTIIEKNMKGRITSENIKDGVKFKINLPL